MSEKYIVNGFHFESKNMYEKAVKEHTVITSMREKCQLSDGKIALKMYQKAVKEGVFTTVVGYSFLRELRETIVKSGVMKEERLAEIPVKGDVTEPGGGTATRRIGNPERYKMLYEGQCVLNRRIKIILAALIVLVAALVIIDIKSEYSVFTYFTDYKAKMEEELLDKYEHWESELKAREDALEKNQE